jgi:hypothetical protein
MFDLPQLVKGSSSERDVLCLCNSRFDSNRYFHGLHDFPHAMKGVRNNLGNSLAPSETSTDNIPPNKKKNEAYRQVMLKNIEEPGGQSLVPVFWDKHFMTPFLERQISLGRLSIHPKLDSQIFYAVLDKSSSPKMNVKLAAAFFSRTMQREDMNTVSYLRELNEVEYKTTIDAILAVQPIKRAMDEFMHIMNGRDLQSEINSGSDQCRKYVRVKHGEPVSDRLLSALRGVSVQLEIGLQDIKDSQVRDIITNRLLSGYCQERNYISYQTMNAISNISYGVPSLIYHYTKMLCPGADVFLGDLTTDFCERHFRNLKQKQTTLKAITDSEARCVMINDY